ncbi:hypothetical protein GCM10009623_34550 [Nocardioides aestuarii]|uniref:Calcium-binding protein n=1 Tax=Nocardioides aestuarii TaxID=252231 RepID=A0ABW4TSG4_9ACTN
MSVALTPTASQAAGPTGAVTITANDAATYRGDCVNVPITITSHYDASGTGTWNGAWAVEVEVTDPYGSYDDSHDYSGVAASTSFKDFLCVGRYNTGVYDVTATWEQYDAAGQVIATGTATDSFSLKRKPPAKTRLKVTKDPYGSTGWKFTGKLTREGRPHKWESVSLWIRWHGYWRNYRETKVTGSRGQVSWHTARDIPTNRYVFQLRYKGDNRSASARSDRFQLPRR